MCGICGIVDRASGPISESDLVALRDSLTHRGPDDAGILLREGVGLGARRLSVIDLSPLGHMPMSNEDDSVWITYNGEVYNFRELRSQLEERGHRFRSHTDTEVIVHAYEEWGDACAERLAGMFAFAIWDSPRSRLFLARDRLGVKPLYFIEQGSRLVFASEAHGLHRFFTASAKGIDPLALDYYLAYGYTPPDRGFLSEIRKLPAAHSLVFDADGLRIERYWSVAFRPSLRLSDSDALDAVEERLRTAVERRLVADVPVGCFLSGGIDSGLITAFAARASSKPLHTFSVGFSGADPGADERPLAALVASEFGTHHQELVVAPGQKSALPQILWHMAEPFADISALPMSTMSREARHFITVALSGDGGDESFAGYPNVRSAYFGEWMRAFAPAPIRSTLYAALSLLTPTLPFSARAARWLHFYAQPELRKQFGAAMTWDDALRTRLYSGDARVRLGRATAFDIIARVQIRAEGLGAAEMHLFTDLQLRLGGGYLRKVDIASNMASLEVRSPFLDHELVELAASLPIRQKLPGGRQKGLLRKLAARYLPGSIVTQRKRGFAPDTGAWIRGEWAPFVRDLLPNGSLARSGLFDPVVIARVVDDHLAGRASHGQRIWSLVCLEIWWRLFLDQSLSVSDTV